MARIVTASVDMAYMITAYLVMAKCSYGLTDRYTIAVQRPTLYGYALYSYGQLQSWPSRPLHYLRPKGKKQACSHAHGHGHTYVDMHVHTPVSTHARTWALLKCHWFYGNGSTPAGTFDLEKLSVSRFGQVGCVEPQKTLFRFPPLGSRKRQSTNHETRNFSESKSSTKIGTRPVRLQYSSAFEMSQFHLGLSPFMCTRSCRLPVHMSIHRPYTRLCTRPYTGQATRTSIHTSINRPCTRLHARLHARLHTRLHSHLQTRLYAHLYNCLYARSCAGTGTARTAVPASRWPSLASFCAPRP